MGKAKRIRTKYHLSSVQSGFNVLPSGSKFIDQNEATEYANDESNIPVKRIVKDTDLPSDFHADLEKDKSLLTSKLDSDISQLRNESGEWKVIPADDLFKNVDINIDQLETKIQIEADVKPSNISISKCIKRCVVDSGMDIHLRKNDKRELRRNLFIKKIDAIHREILKKKPKKIKENVASAEISGKKSKWEISSGKIRSKVSKFPKVPKSMNHLPDLKCGKISKRKQIAMAKLKSKTQEMLNNIEFFNQIISDRRYRSDAMGVVTDAIQKKVYSDL